MLPANNVNIIVRINIRIFLIIYIYHSFPQSHIDASLHRPW